MGGYTDPDSGEWIEIDPTKKGPTGLNSNISQDNQHSIDRIKKCLGEGEQKPCEWNVNNKYCRRCGYNLDKAIHWCDNTIKTKPI